MNEMMNEIKPGTRVEVQSSFDRGWKRGFVIEAADIDGYRLRRQSDDSVLPTAFSPDVVRKERKQGLWWA